MEEMNEESQPENTISSMRDSGEFLDVDLRCNDGSFGIQKLVLIMHSEYYRRLFLRLDSIASKTGKPSANACIILEDVEPLDIVNIITYMYEGKVNVMQADIPGFISVARQLRIEDILSNIPHVEMIQNASLNLNETPQPPAAPTVIEESCGQKRALIDSLNLLRSKARKRPKMSHENKGTENRGHQCHPRICTPKPCSKTCIYRNESSSSESEAVEDSQSILLQSHAKTVYRPTSGTWLVKDNNYMHRLCCRGQD